MTQFCQNESTLQWWYPETLNDTASFVNLLPAATTGSSMMACDNLRQADSGETWSMLQAAFDIMRGFTLSTRCYSQLATASKTPLLLWLIQNAVKEAAGRFWLSSVEVNILVTMALVWTIVRILFEDFVAKPFAQSLGVFPKNIAKFTESSWKSLAYAMLWSSAFYVTFFRGHDFFFQTLQMFRLEPNQRFDLKVIYALEGSFYIHSLFATLYMDVKRKDTFAMMAHHVVTLTLMFSSYRGLELTIGVLIFVLDDINDVLLEIGKTFSYLRETTRFGFSNACNHASNFCGLAFAIFWVVNRLFFGLTKVWRAGALGVWVSHRFLPCPMCFQLEFILASLYGFYCYWFWFIALLIVRLFTSKQAEDPRDD